MSPGLVDWLKSPMLFFTKLGRAKITCTVTSVRPMRGFCYLKSDKTQELIRVKLEAVNKTLSAKSSIVTVGMKLLAEVISVNDKVVEYKIAI